NGAQGPAGSQGPTGPQGATGPAGSAAALTRYAGVAGEVTTSSTSYVGLGGPEVTVTVPASGTILVAASASSTPTADSGGAISLFEDGRQLDGQASDTICNGAAGVLFDVEATGTTVAFGTPGGPGFGGFCATVGPPGTVAFQTLPGRHTYELRYANDDCGCGTTAGFANRKLWVIPQP
ncbi:MAG TPA: hypothetical protein VLK58_00225, partial [Conexibacter sp.]|nr:hypothetical protein [Conexibacter sp.]